MVPTVTMSLEEYKKLQSEVDRLKKIIEQPEVKAVLSFIEKDKNRIKEFTTEIKSILT